jgi:hypothetical protein
MAPRNSFIDKQNPWQIILPKHTKKQCEAQKNIFILQSSVNVCTHKITM